MRFCFGVVLAALLTLCQALRVVDGSIKTGHVSSDGEIFLTPKSQNLQVSFRLQDLPADKTPRQVFVTVGDARNDVSATFFPVLKNGKYGVSIPISKVSDYLKSQNSLTVSVIVGDFDKSLNSIKVLGSVTPKFENLQYEAPARFGKKPEIFHIFRSETETAPPIIAKSFMAAILVLLLSVFYFWYKNGANVSNTPKQLKNVVYHFGFLGTLILFQLTFFSYYVETSIFTTLGRIALIGCGALFFGSRVLRTL